ncbi:DNA polymerase delta small subunit-like [Copidosoma floridanum]|uniref:DNA polymerase delta small subunit-like n=1 Tax=Copidosoma floridanum TaxID=29053 RepID=UPI0006C9B49C|nr:DNA polymerase delta small subunit-like [Copidosoma floridanum]
MAEIDRKKAEFEDFERFKVDSKNFSQQFCGIYKARLSLLKPEALKCAKAKWKNKKCIQIVDLIKDEYKEVSCVIIGTLYKHQALKPSILKEIADELQAVPQPPRLNYCNPKDALFLEDDVARIRLVGNLTPEALVTGLTSALCGHGLNDGSFWVEDFCFPGLYLNPLMHPISCCAKDSGKMLLLLSGLDFANKADNLSMELLSDWITGLIGDENTQMEAASVVKVIVAGNSVKGTAETFTRKGYFENKKKDSLFAEEMHQAVRRFDRFIEKIAKSCDTIVMPGEFDPSCHTLPQHPLHPNLLPRAKKVNLYGATNPWIGKIGSRVIAGSSGQPIMDIMKVSDVDISPLGWLEKTLEWQHYAPTAPDTLAEYPFDQMDPFVMHEYPNIYFVGNMNRYESKIVQGVDRNDDSEGQPIRLICIPKFATSHTAVLVDLESLDARPISFG